MQDGNPLGNLLRQPLLHFLAAGLLIFVAYAWLEGNGDAEQADLAIRVDRDALINFMQYRAQAFDRESFARQFDSLDDDQRQALVRDYVLEEAKFREALSLGLDEGDYDIRLRLVQKLSFVLEDIAAGRAEQFEPDPNEVRSYFELHADRYRIDPVYTFTHVYFDNEKHGEARAHELAEALLPMLRRENPDPIEAARRGDRFRYLWNYKSSQRDQVVNNFGQEFVDQLDRLPVEEPVWTGPIASLHGWHLVLLTARTEARLPDLDEIYDQVVYDLRYEVLIDALQKEEQELLEKYEVVVEIP